MTFCHKSAALIADWMVNEIGHKLISQYKQKNEI